MFFEDWTKYLGLVSLVVTWLAIFIVLSSNAKELHKSISHHAAKKQKIYVVFALLITLALAAMFGFLVGWLVPELSFAFALVVLFVVALVMELVTTWVPLTEGKSYRVHNTLSYGTALLMPIIYGVMLATVPFTQAGLIVMCGSLAIMLILLGMFFFVPKSLEKYLVYQSMYIAAFQLGIVALPFLQ